MIKTTTKIKLKNFPSYDDNKKCWNWLIFLLSFWTTWEIKLLSTIIETCIIARFIKNTIVRNLNWNHTKIDTIGSFLFNTISICLFFALPVVTRINPLIEVENDIWFFRDKKKLLASNKIWIKDVFIRNIYYSTLDTNKISINNVLYKFQ